MARPKWRVLARIARFIACVALATACGSDPAKDERGQLEIFSWWAGSEAAPLDAVLALYRTRYPQITVVNSAVLGGGGQNAKAKLRERMLKNEPPDAFQVHAGAEVRDWIYVNPGDIQQSRLEALDTLYDEQGWRRVMTPDVIEALSYEGHVFAFPIGIHKGNVLFYNLKMFADAGLSPPTTLAELHTVVAKLKERDPKAVALTIGYKDSWTLSDLFQNVLIAIAGPGYYRAFFNGEKSAEDPEIKATLQEMTSLLALADPEGPRMDWTEASRRVVEGKAAMNIMGDWAKGFYLTLGAHAKVDYGVAPSPGTTDTFVVVIDSFALPKDAPDRDNALAFLRLIGSPEGQITFNALKGSLPVRLDVDLGKLDEASREDAAKFPTDEHVLTLDSAAPADFVEGFRAILATFTVDHDPDPVLHYLQNRYSQLRPR
jgi:glucose/mannose transport system substrate-binding protein